MKGAHLFSGADAHEQKLGASPCFPWHLCSTVICRALESDCLCSKTFSGNGNAVHWSLCTGLPPPPPPPPLSHWSAQLSLVFRIFLRASRRKLPCFSSATTHESCALASCSQCIMAAQVQCIIHFLQLPIEDQFLDEMERSQPASAAAAAGLHLPTAPAAVADKAPGANGNAADSAAPTAPSAPAPSGQCQ